MALRLPPDDNDCIFEHIAGGPEGTYTAPFPLSFDLRHRPGARDQGDRPTCAAFVGAVIAEMNSSQAPLSPEFIYFHRQNKPAKGMFGRDVMAILQKIGTVFERFYPYRDDELAPGPDNEMYEEAVKHKTTSYARVTTADGLKRALLESGPCLVILPCYSTGPEFWNGDGTADGHAVAAIGYNERGFLLLNSWGPEWNGDGCTLLPFENFDCVWEIWSAK